MNFCLEMESQDVFSEDLKPQVGKNRRRKSPNRFYLNAHLVTCQPNKPCSDVKSSKSKKITAPPIDSII